MRATRPADRESRRTTRWLAGGAAIVALAAALAWWWPRGEAFALLPASTDQNILLVTIDTLRADALSSYGGPAETPNLDRLASHGARFTFAHSHAVVTLPSHTTILTGRLPYEHGMRDNSGFRVKEGTATLATMLKPLGFATGAFVGGFPVSKRFGLTPGFDVYDDQLPEMKGEVNFALPERRADVVVSRATDWIGKQPGKFFAWVHAFDPHSPYRPPDDLAAKYSAQPYYGEVAFVDRALGPLFDRLSTLSRPTLVVVTADHGESLGEHGEHDARDVRVRGDAPRAAHRRGDQAERVARDPRRRDRHARQAHRHRPDGARGRRRGDGWRAARTLAPRSHPRRQRTRSAAVLRVDDLQPRARLGAAPGRAGREEQVHRSPDSRALRSRRRSERGGATSPRRPPIACRCCSTR